MTVSKGTCLPRPVLLRQGAFAIAAWVLLIGYLPSLTFLGHFPLDVNIPGTSLYIGLPETGAPVHNDAVTTANVGGANIHVHEEHCHINLSSCSDVPYTGSAGFALLGWAVAFLGVSGLAFAVFKRQWQPVPDVGERPPVPPPRASA